MFSAIADTHTALWYLYDDVRLSGIAGDFIDRSAAAGNQIAVSSISLVEIIYLIEKARIPASTYRDFQGSASQRGDRRSYPQGTTH